MNSESVRIFQRVSTGAFTSIDLRISNSFISLVLEENISSALAPMIGKTRHPRETLSAAKPEATVQQVYDAAAGPPRGILQTQPVAGQFRHARRSPSPELAHCIAHYWFVSWDLRGLEPYIAETLPHPNVHAIFEPSGSTVAGVHTAKFSRRLEGRSHTFGVKFTPGGFRAF